MKKTSSSQLTVKSDAIILPSGLFDGYITSEDGKITAVTKKPPASKGEYLDVTGYYVAPGFIDMHTHGGGGHDFMDGDVRCITEAALTHMRHGTTTIIPSSVASSLEELYTFIDNFREAKHILEDGPCLWGMHLEGPYFNKAQAGAQDPQYIKDPTPGEYKSIATYGKDAITRWSVAPELDGALEMGDYLASHGILPSIGHSDAEYADVISARNHHYTLVTHLYSGMSTIVRKGGYRKLGVIESAYLIDDMDVEIIADGHHLPAELLRFIYKFKGPDRIALVTDSMRAAGMPDGESVLGSLKSGQKVIVEGGVAKLTDRTAFAGSVATTDRLVRVMHIEAGIDVANTIKMITSTPARILGATQKGTIAVHKDCDLTVFDNNIGIKAVVIGGNIRHIIGG